jgi:hypothetical protein
MLGTIGSIVKIVKDEHEVLDTFPQCLDAPTSFVFIELFDSASSDDLTLDGSSMTSLIVSPQCLAS